ncbi:uncharacterized protein LOC124360258 [Homalodisca vitripennis]|uniref:uncharacterized protein LOC124360258 n=1 Tax=Homalodisca vitripennis TaxID=197043 RepID=UPI001EEA6B42|nr:uncharacterized protein LOC124360258 [Homalodisca vitripennis]
MITVTSSWILLLFLAASEYTMCLCGEIIVPHEYTALSGDLQVDVLGVTTSSCVQLLERSLYPPEDETEYSVLGSAVVQGSRAGDPSLALSVVFPCGVIARGGHYGLRLTTQLVDHQCISDPSPYSSSTVWDNEATEHHLTVTTEPAEDEIVPLDVRWPGVTLDIEPKTIQTYPEVPVVAQIRFQSTHCQPAIGSLVPETWLDLVYCGHSPANCVNSTLKQLLYSEQIRGYPSLREITLPCNSFGLAGHYALALRSTMMTMGPLIAFTSPENTVKAVWSDKFVFNVHARSIFPCDGHAGINVLFQYPGCILESGDRVRVFGRLRADVAAVAPPSTLHYLAEHKVSRGQHALTFDCDLFTERYVEYCFVYVSQAISGAVSDVRMDCVPTLPVHEAESGGWGSWTSWTKCTTTCSGGTRNRYRLCDSPPPRYGAKFCEGHALETERCGVAVGWDCTFYQDSGGLDVPAERPEVKAEVGPGCRCGCVVHLGLAKPRRLVASSSQSCPGRTFWLIQADRNQVIRLSLEQFRLPCSAQWLKIRDGDALSSTLLAHLTGVLTHHPVVNSSSNLLLLEFFSDELAAVGEECWGGFLAHVQQLARTVNSLAHTEVSMVPAISPLERLALVHIAVILLLIIVLLTSTCLGAQYMARYRKYQLAAANEDMESLAISLGESVGSLVPARSRATSSTTLLSEVISLRRFRPHRHMRLADHDAEEDEHEFDSAESVRDDEVREGDGDARVELSESTADVEVRPTSLDVPQQRARNQPDTPRIHKPYNKYKSPVSPVEEKPESPEAVDTDNTQQQSRRSSNGGGGTVVRSSVSSSVSSSLTNALSSPASSLRSNPKETKDKRNRERLLAGSEFSLAGDLEMDYYDYNVSNASTVPGSYLGMDPAFCLWIPPFAPGRWDDDEDDRLLGLSDGDDTELHDLSKLSERTVKEYLGDEGLDATTEFSGREKDEGSGASTPVNVDQDKDAKSEKSYHDCYSLKQFSQNARQQEVLEEIPVIMVEKLVPNSPVKVHRAYRVKEKETGLEKSPSDESEYYDLLDNEEEDDIKFADDDDEEDVVKKGALDLAVPQIKSNRSSYYDV